MCWLSHIYPVKKIAKHDIVVIKLCKMIRNKLVSTVFNFEYEYDTVYSTDDKLKVLIEYEYADDITLRYKKEKSIISIPQYIINEGFHSYNYKFIKTLLDDTPKFCCIIPKGSVYYEDDKGEYVSDHIIIKCPFTLLNYLKMKLYCTLKIW